MASKINADEFVDREGEGKPTLPKGVVLSGVTTITTAVVAENEVANSTGINAGIITSTHFKGNLTGDVNAGIVTVTSQTVVGSAVTISASGIDIGAGVITATSYVGSGANLTGIGATIMVWEYNPDPDATSVLPLSLGIGITFNQKIKAGSGNITLRTGGYDGTVVENFGIGSSVTISGNSLSFNPTNDLAGETAHYVTLPSGVITNMAGDSYAGTEYSFTTGRAGPFELWIWGMNPYGELGQNNNTKYSSPIQIPGDYYNANPTTGGQGGLFVEKTSASLWGWGTADNGSLGNNAITQRSSPVQIPGTTWGIASKSERSSKAIKTDGTLWSWGINYFGALGQNQPHNFERSSPVQVGSDTTWSNGTKTLTGYSFGGAAIKTDGTLWSWGYASQGRLGVNDNIQRSSPTQIPGTTWSKVELGGTQAIATKTDGTLWAWGNNTYGQLGQNARTQRSSPVQIGSGTDWNDIAFATNHFLATKTDGTAWGWGKNEYGMLGLNDRTHRSSPTQIPGTTWDLIDCAENNSTGLKTDGTLWTWGYNGHGDLGQNNTTDYSSPVQVGSLTTWVLPVNVAAATYAGLKSS